MNVGFQMGAQFLIAKRVSLDFYFLGLEAGFLSGNVSATTNVPLGAVDLKTSMDKAIADMPSMFGSKLKAEQSGNMVGIKASGLPYPWLRGGISIGIAF